MSSVDSYRFHYHRLRHELGNYSLLRLRGCDGVIFSMHQSGTHWLKFMLASAISDHYGIAAPQYNHANDIIGGAKDAHHYAEIPCIKSSHTIAPLLIRNRLASGLVRLPPCVLLVRDIRASLVSNYNKWQTRYAVSFSEYLRGDPAGRRFNSDIWWCIRFLNAWGRMAALAAGCFHVVRYEDLIAAPSPALDAVARHLRLPLPLQSIEVGVKAASKPAMAERSDPARPPGEINDRNDDPMTAYGAADREFVRLCCDKFLHRSFGYDYSNWA